MPGWQKETELRSAKSCANTISPFVFANTISPISSSHVFLGLVKLELYMIWRAKKWYFKGLIEINLRIDSGSNKSCGKTWISKKFFEQ